MGIVRNPDGSITVGIIPAEKPKEEPPAPVKRGGRPPKNK